MKVYQNLKTKFRNYDHHILVFANVESLRNKISLVYQEFPKQWGRGEWTAKTMDDAKQMAVDFCEGVS